MPAAQAVMEEVMGLLCEHLPGLKLPNIHGNKKSPVGQICYHLGDMMFQTFNVPPTGIEFITEPLEADGKPSSDPNGIITLVRQTIIIKDIEVSATRYWSSSLSLLFLGEGAAVAVFEIKEKSSFQA